MIRNKINKAISEYGMLDCSSLLVGFSGGADSCALLDVLHKLCKTKNIKVHALHVNHMIRGEEATRDSNFCVEFCRKREIPITVIEKDIPALAKEQKKGLEECARDFRYSCFEEFCSKNGFDRIATAHNANDNTETVIFNLARGSGIRGLCGIPPVRENVIRPLIYCQKSEIIEYCRQNSIEYMNDSTNDCDDYTRNHIRHNITPKLTDINKDAVEAISRSSAILRRDLFALDFIAESYINSSDTELKKLPEAVIVRVLLLRYKNSVFDPSSLEEKHVSAILKLFLNGSTADRISLPNKSRAVRQKEGILFEKDVKAPEKVNETFPLHYGINIIPELNCRIDIYKDGENFKKIENVYNLTMNAEFFSDTMDWCNSIYCRGRKEGDSYRFGKMTRSIKKLLWQLEIPAENRVNFPVICDSEGIMLLPGFPIRDDLKAKKGEKYIIYIYLFEA
jgi:tRNA(Ile)-lysidine synthase